MCQIVTWKANNITLYPNVFRDKNLELGIIQRMHKVYESPQVLPFNSGVNISPVSRYVNQMLNEGSTEMKIFPLCCHTGKVNVTIKLFAK